MAAGVARVWETDKRAQAWHPAQHPGQDHDHVREMTTIRLAARPANALLVIRKVSAGLVGQRRKQGIMRTNRRVIIIFAAGAISLSGAAAG